MPPLTALRQTAAEVLAYSLTGLFPGILFADNEVSDSGFFYDVCLQEEISDEIIPLLEERMRACVKDSLSIVRMEMMRENAMAYFAHLHQPFKVELVGAMPGNVVRVCKIGEFADACPGSTLENTDEVGAFKILKIEQVAASLPSTQHLSVVRIHGTAFSNKMDLKRFLKKYEAAKRLDHRLLGREMHLFSYDESASPGFPFWLPKGAILRQLLQDWWWQLHPSAEYQVVATPPLAETTFLKKYDRDLSIVHAEIEGREMAAPLNRELMHALTFKMHGCSIQDLPVRYVEWDEQIYADKNPGLWGLFRCRSRFVDRASIFCSSSQLDKELISSLQFIDKTVKMFGIECRWVLRAKARKTSGHAERWNQGETALIKALKECGLGYSLDKADAMSHGPRVEVRLTDALGREWIGPFLGVNVNFPDQLGMKCQSPGNAQHAPMMIGRSLFGALELFVGILIEQCAGVFPLWLAPEQVRVVSVSEKTSGYAEKVLEACLQAGLRARMDAQNESLGTKVHAAELEKVPYLIIIGDREEKLGAITVRQAKEKAKKMELGSFIKQLLDEIKNSICPQPASED